jgi:ribonuclease VapC
VIDGSRDPIAGLRFDEFFKEADISVEPVTLEQARLAREAYRDFKGSGHPAKLNFGDCFAYALAKAIGEPLLFKGDDRRRQLSQRQQNLLYEELLTPFCTI